MIGQRPKCKSMTGQILKNALQRRKKTTFKIYPLWL